MYINIIQTQWVYSLWVTLFFIPFVLLYFTVLNLRWNLSWSVLLICFITAISFHVFMFWKYNSSYCSLNVFHRTNFKYKYLYPSLFLFFFNACIPLDFLPLLIRAGGECIFFFFEVPSRKSVLLGTAHDQGHGWFSVHQTDPLLQCISDNAAYSWVHPELAEVRDALPGMLQLGQITAQGF